MKIKGNNQIFFFKRLAFLLNAGIPLHTSISIIKEQSKGKVGLIFSQISADITTGKSLSDSLSKFPKSFPSYVVHMLRAGEETGQLSEYTKILAEELLRKKTMQGKIISALIYPVVIALATISLSLFLILSIFPKVKTLFVSLHVKLPLSTRIILSLTDFFHKYGLILLVIIILLCVFFPKKYFFKFPFIGLLIKNYCLIIFFRTVGMMLSSHITLERALYHASESISQTEYKQAISLVNERTKSGNTLASSLALYPALFPRSTIQLVEIGETSGALSETCIHISEMIEQDNEYFIKNILTIIEPVLMICMGFLVGFIALSMITPIYGITQNLKH